jgi:hypothetical protein
MSERTVRAEPLWGLPTSQGRAGPGSDLRASSPEGDSEECLLGAPSGHQPEPPTIGERPSPSLGAPKLRSGDDSRGGEIGRIPALVADADMDGGDRTESAQKGFRWAAIGPKPK